MAYCYNVNCLKNKNTEFNSVLEGLYKQWLDRETWCHVERYRKLAERRHYGFDNSSRQCFLDVPYKGRPFTYKDSSRPVYFPGERRQFPEQKNRSHLSGYMP